MDDASTREIYEAERPQDAIADYKAEITSLRSQLDEARAETARLEKLVYVPGLWRCPKCEFQLVQANLNAGDGSVTARDQPGDKCPNCNSPLWRVTERDAGNKLIDDAERVCMEQQTRIDEARRKAIEECIGVVAEMRKGFRSPEYATGQPVSSVNERIACSMILNNLKALIDGDVT